MKKTIAKLIGKAAVKSAEKSTNSASACYCYQAKEPKDMKNRLKTMN